MRERYENTDRTVEQTPEVTENTSTGEQITEVDDSPEQYEDCAVEETPNAETSELSTEASEEFEDDYDDCEKNYEDVETKYEEKTEEIEDDCDDYNDCAVKQVNENIEEAEPEQEVSVEDIEEEQIAKQSVEQITEETDVELSEVEEAEIQEEIEQEIESRAEEGEIKTEEVQEIVDEKVEEQKDVEEQQDAEQEEVSFEQRMDEALGKEEVSSSELKELQEENSEKISSAMEEKEQLTEEMNKKFEEVMSKERGSEEYKEALQEYNSLKDRNNEIDEQLKTMKEQQESLEEKRVEVRNTQLAKGEKAIQDSQETLDTSKQLQEKYDKDFYEAKPDKKELEKLQEDNVAAINEMSEQKESIKTAMDAKMEEISEYVNKNKMERYDTEHDPQYQEMMNDYRSMKDVHDKLDYNIIKLDENNKSISEMTGREYGSIQEGEKASLGEKTTETKDVHSFKSKISAFFNKSGDVEGSVQKNEEITETTEVNQDVVEAQKLIDNYCKSDLENVLSDEKKAIRLNDTVEFQKKEDFAKGLNGRGNPEHINGYNDGKKSYVKEEGPHPKKTAIHEHNHQLSCNDVKNAEGKTVEYRRGISIDGKDVQTNEALTELFTKKMMGDEYPPNPSVAYRDNMLRMEKMEEGFGKDTLKEAYYKNKPELLKQKYEDVMGEGKWEELSKAFDESLSDYSPAEIDAKREHYKKTGSILQTSTDIRRQRATEYANKCATLFQIKAKGKR